jgi:hypothetical protein
MSGGPEPGNEALGVIALSRPRIYRKRKILIILEIP